MQRREKFGLDWRPMDFDFREWLHLLTRWFHVVVGIMWIGQTYLFGWMDSNLEEAEEDDEIEGRLWMIHSGGFYRVEKQKLAPRKLPAVLHWFKWEAGLTWLSGFLLLWVVYYTGGALLEYGSEMSVAAGTAIGIGVLVFGWLAYDLLWMSPLGRKGVGVPICFAAVVALAWALTQVLSGRAAFIHIGALFGTIMAANVFMRILPGQRQLVAAAEAGTPPDATLAERAKQRSTHNTYMSVPLIFIMISSHFPTSSYGSKYNWVMLGVFVLLGWAGRKVMTLLR